VDEAQVREHAEEHARAIERGDLAAATADFVPEMREAVPEIAKTLPQPVNTGEVLSVEAKDDHAVVQIRYTGDDSAVTIQTRWEDRDGTPLIVTGKPIE
jgi:5,10-methenyltetrahydromethanopterin hydrogenase